MPIYLYVKTHKITGLKYLGQTSKDPFKYNGSGTYWLKHLKKHGYEIDTEILGVFDSKEELRKVSIPYSIKEDIVRSDKWANLMPESGDGLSPGWTQAVVAGKIIALPSDTLKSKALDHPNKGRKYSPEVNKKKGRSTKRSEATKNNISAGIRRYYENGGASPVEGKKWFHNTELKQELYDCVCPSGWTPGRLPESEQTRLKKKEAHKDQRWYHDPVSNQETCSNKGCPDGWLPGRIKRKKLS